MTLSNKKANIILCVIIALSLAISTFYMFSKQGYHEDELLTYNLANSSKELNVDGGWNDYDDFNEYLSVSDNDRFDYAQVYQNQIIDASHPPFYYALVHTVCSFFPNQFSKWFAYSINVFAMAGILILLFKIAKRVSGNNYHSILATAGYAFSLACITTTIYLRMYATLTFFVLAFVYLTLRVYDRKDGIKLIDCGLTALVVALGALTQYYFILYAGLTGLVFLVFTVKDKRFADLIKFIASALVGGIIALCVYPYIISNVFGGNRGLSSLDLSSLDIITMITYLNYKIFTYVKILAKDMFINQVWLLSACVGFAVGSGIYFRFYKKQKLSRNATIIAVPAIVFFCVISLVSPFNSDRYVMASLPIIAALFVFAFIRFFNLVKQKKARLILPASMALVFLIAFLTVQPYYIYGKTNLYQPKTDNAVFVGTSMLEWNKCIDKFMQYDETMIVKTTKTSKTLGDELEEFASERGIVTNGKISELAAAFMTNGSVDRKESDSLNKLSTDEKLNSLSEVTVYISRLADEDEVKDYIINNTKFKNCELIQKDRSFDEFFNWYDYFVETESYCNVYRFY